MTKVSLVIPTYRNPSCLDICLQSATENRVDKQNKIIVVVDGYFGESEDVLRKYAEHIDVIDNETNRGMQYSQNVGVMHADTPYIWIINDDNVLPTRWDVRILKEIEACKTIYGDRFVLTVNQLEPPTGGRSMFYFPELALGETPAEFQYQEYLRVEPSYSKPILENTGNIYPFVIEKKWYLAVGGFDTFYNSPNICDWDFFLRLELFGFASPRTHSLHLYHFGSVSTKKNSESQSFKDKEARAMSTYVYKWGTNPHNTDKTNSKIPEHRTFRGFTVS